MKFTVIGAMIMAIAIAGVATFAEFGTPQGVSAQGADYRYTYAQCYRAWDMSSVGKNPAKSRADQQRGHRIATHADCEAQFTARHVNDDAVTVGGLDTSAERYQVVLSGWGAGGEGSTATIREFDSLSEACDGRAGHLVRVAGTASWGVCD